MYDIMKFLRESELKGCPNCDYETLVFSFDYGTHHQTYEYYGKDGWVLHEHTQGDSSGCLECINCGYLIEEDDYVD